MILEGDLNKKPFILDSQRALLLSNRIDAVEFQFAKIASAIDYARAMAEFGGVTKIKYKLEVFRAST